VIDKKTAGMLVFDAQGKLLGASPVLIGVAAGDDSTPGSASKDCRRSAPPRRPTPAGDASSPAKASPRAGQQVLWVDWSTSVALHAVVTGQSPRAAASSAC
jgi:hypothetical protein